MPRNKWLNERKKSRGDIIKVCVYLLGLTLLGLSFWTITGRGNPRKPRPHEVYEQLPSLKIIQYTQSTPVDNRRYRNKIHNLATKRNTATPDNAIHLFLVIDKLAELNKAHTMFKSLVYHHRIERHESIGCSIDWLEPPGRKRCAIDTGSLPDPEPLKLHLVVHPYAWNTTKHMFTGWNSSKITVYLNLFQIDLEYFGDGMSKIEAAIQQLNAPYILGRNVEKVIALHPNLLFNDDVSKLWRQFEQFNPHQIIGAVCEQAGDCVECCPNSDDRFPTYGFNMALRLLHLKNMRRINWDNMYKTELGTDQYVKEKTGDINQGVTNVLLSKRIRLRHTLPCEWNVHAKTSAGMRSCPVRLIEREPGMELCDWHDNQSIPIPNVAVMQHDVLQQVDFTYEENEQERSTKEAEDTPLTLGRMRERFVQIYGQFQRLPVECFQPRNADYSRPTKRRIRGN